MTHINAYLQDLADAKQALVAAEAAVADAAARLNQARLANGEEVEEPTPPAEASPAHEGEEEAKTKKLRYR